MADAFSAVRAQAAKAAKRGAQDQSGLLRNSTARKATAELFRRNGTATAAKSQTTSSSVTALLLGCVVLVENGFLELQNRSRKNRAYRLGQAYFEISGNH